MKIKLYRIIDANYNRLKEGLRVCEDIIRFNFEDKALTRNYKDIRHKTTAALKTLKVNSKTLFDSRDSKKDVGRKTAEYELNKKTLEELFLSNLQRAKESFRVLEEVSKLISKNTALQFKGLRYNLYELEKKTFKKISSLSNRR
jgi:thiamine-phosphate pyrophosphorylase